jgi:hypothetical protein
MDDTAKTPEHKTFLSPDDEPARLAALRASLTHLRGLLAGEDDGSKAAGLSREIRALLAEIDALDTTKAGSKLDELEARRAARKSASESSVSADRGK